MDISEVKQNLNQTVIYHNRDYGETKYKLTGCIIRKNKKNKFYYEAEIQDLKAKQSLTICSLDKISAIKL